MTSPAPHPRIPGLIEVVRGRRGIAEVLIDGQRLPWAVSSAHPIAVDITPNCTPAITLTLPASSVVLRDELLAGVDLNVAHQHQTAHEGQ